MTPARGRPVLGVVARCALCSGRPRASWRKRRKGPPYIRVGNAYLYPLAGLREYLHARVRADDAEEVALL